MTSELNDHTDHTPGPVWDLSAASVQTLEDVERVLERQWLEEQKVARVVVGADGLRVGVDHHRFETHVLAGECRLAAAVVELDPLPDPVWTTPENDDLGPVAYADLIIEDGLPIASERGLVGRVVVGRDRFEFSGTGIDKLEDGTNTGVGLPMQTDSQDVACGDPARDRGRPAADPEYPNSLAFASISMGTSSSLSQRG